MEVRCCFPERNVLNVVVVTVKSANRALIPSSCAVRVDTWLENAHRIEVRLKVMLSLGLILRI